MTWGRRNVIRRRLGLPRQSRARFVFESLYRWTK